MAQKTIIFRATLLLVAAALALAVPLADARAQYLRTECPLVRPDNPTVRFFGGGVLENGTISNTLPDIYYKDENRVEHSVSDYRRMGETYTAARLECFYSDRSRIYLDIPGTLLKCGGAVRVTKGRPWEKARVEYLGEWCESEVN